MKIQKGQPGYLKTQTKKLLIQSLIGFGIVIALLVTGYVQTGTKLNWLTFIAVLGCLPAAKVLVGLITILPYRSIDPAKANEIREKAPLLTTAFDMVITSREKIMPVDAIVISNNTICGYAGNKKTDPEDLAKHIKNILSENQFSKITVKIFPEYKAFLSRAEGMNNIAQIEKEDSRKREKMMRQIILNISM